MFSYSLCPAVGLSKATKICKLVIDRYGNNNGIDKDHQDGKEIGHVETRSGEDRFCRDWVNFYSGGVMGITYKILFLGNVMMSHKIK